MPVPADNYDNTSVGRYIRAIENPDSVGYDAVRHRWYAPSNIVVFDKNNRGMGIDVVHNSDAAATARGRTGKWLTEQEERDLRNGHIAYSLGVMDRRTPLVVKGAVASPTLQDMAVGVIYKGNANELFNPTTPMGNAYLSGDEQSLDKEIQKFYTGRNTERVRNHKAYMDEKRRKEQEEQKQKSIITQMEARRQSLNQWGDRWKRKRGDGGPLSYAAWEDLPIAERAAYIDAAVRNGLTDLTGIRKTYRKFAEGGWEGGADDSTDTPMGGSFLVDMTNVGLGAETKPNYYVDRTMFPLEAVTVTPSLLDKTKREYMNEIVAANDATLNADLGRSQNSHLKDRAVRGAAAHAAWEKDNPEAASAGYALGAVPFAVAAAPAWMYTGDALAGTALGRGITAQLTNPYSYTSMGLMGTGLADAGSKIYNGQTGYSLVDDAMTAAELLPLGYMAAKGAGMTYDMAKSVLYSTPQYRNYRIAKEISKNVSAGVNPTFSDNMMYRYTLPQEVEDLMMYGQYRDMPTGQTVRRAYNSESEIAKRLANRERVRAGKRSFTLFKENGNSHGGKAFAKGEPWKGTVSSGSTDNLIVETPGTAMRTGHHGSYSDLKQWNDIKHGEGLWKEFAENGDTGIPVDGSTVYYKNPDGTWGFRTLYNASAHHRTVR